MIMDNVHKNLDRMSQISEYRSLQVLCTIQWQPEAVYECYHCWIRHFLYEKPGVVVSDTNRQNRRSSRCSARPLEHEGAS